MRLGLIASMWVVALLCTACGNADEESRDDDSVETFRDESFPAAAAEIAVQAMLRHLVAAQAQFQQAAPADENNNGTGEYGGFAELAGKVGVRGARTFLPAVLPPAFELVKRGAVRRAGYEFKMALPTRDGWAWEHDDGGFRAGVVDAARAERAWVAYAWPIEPGKTGDHAFAVDERGTLYTASVKDVKQAQDAAPIPKTGGWRKVP